MYRKNLHSQYLEKFSNHLIQKGVCAITRRGYVFDTRQFIEWLGENGMDLADVSKHEAQLYIEFLVSQQYLSSTILKKVSSLRAFFEYLENING
jgi:site-specific recombinase XerD